MSARRSSSTGRSGESGGGRPAPRRPAANRSPADTGTKRSAANAGAKSSTANARKRGSAAKRGTKRSRVPAKTGTKRSPGTAAEKSSAGRSEQLVHTIIKPLDLVLISRERIQQTLDEAAERGRVTRGDANDLALELVRRGRQQTDDVLAEIERLLGRGRDQLGTAGRRVRTTEPVDRLVRGADRARRTIGVGPSFPITGYDELTAGQVAKRLDGLGPADLRRVRDYEQRHANRKSVLDAIERKLA